MNNVSVSVSEDLGLGLVSVLGFKVSFTSPVYGGKDLWKSLNLKRKRVDVMDRTVVMIGKMSLDEVDEMKQEVDIRHKTKSYPQFFSISLIMSNISISCK